MGGFMREFFRLDFGVLRNERVMLDCTQMDSGEKELV